MRQRFGRKFEIRATPTAAELAAFNAHVCGAFEDWVYTLFREEQSLTRPGNTHLYGLLCKVRCALKTRLSELLVGSFAFDQPNSPYEEPLVFSGCYFAATGRTPDRQAFVRGVFEKLIDEQEYLEWTTSTVRANQRLSRLGLIGGLAVMLLFGALLLMVGSEYFFR